MSDRSGAVLGVLDRVLTFIDKPWKAVVVLAFAIVGILGFVIYQERVRIADAVLHEPVTRPVLAVDEFTRNADALLRETRSDVVVLAELDLNENVARDRVGFDRDGVHWIPIEGPQPALYPSTDMQLVIRFLRNEVVCGDTAGKQNAEMQALAAAGYRRVCLVAVPPMLGASVGALTVAWKTPLSRAAEERAGIALSTAAMKFARW